MKVRILAIFFSAASLVLMTISPASASVLDHYNVKTKDNLKCEKVKDGPTSKLNKEISSNNKSFKVEKIYAVNIPEDMRKDGFPNYVIAVSVKGNGIQAKTNIVTYLVGSYKKSGGKTFKEPIIALNKNALKLTPKLKRKSIKQHKFKKLLSSLIDSKYEKRVIECTKNSYKKSSVVTTTSQPKTDNKKLNDAIKKTIGKNSRGIKNNIQVLGPEAGGDISITWAIDESLTEGLTKDEARIEATDILKAIVKSKIKYTSVQLIGTYELVDKLGNTKESNVVIVNYTKELVDSINFKNFSFKNVFNIDTTAYIHPAFQY